MIFYTGIDAEFAAYILRFYRFPWLGIKKYIPITKAAPLTMNTDKTIVTFNRGELIRYNWYNIRCTGRTLCQLAYDTAMTWQGVNWYNWLLHPSFIPRYERPDVIEYMSDVNFNLVQSREIQQALGTGRAWTEYLTHTNIKDYLL